MLADGNQHALTMGATLSKGELYVWSPIPGVPDLRQSYHASGQGHVHTPAGRLRHDDSVPTAAFTGSRRLWGASVDPGLVSWNYTPKSDTPKRSTLILDRGTVGQYPSCTVDVWAVETARTDLVEEVLSTYQVVIAHVLAANDAPWLLAIAWSITLEAARSLDEAIGRGPA